MVKCTGLDCFLHPKYQFASILLWWDDEKKLRFIEHGFIHNITWRLGISGCHCWKFVNKISTNFDMATCQRRHSYFLSIVCAKRVIIYSRPTEDDDWLFNDSYSIPTNHILRLRSTSFNIFDHLLLVEQRTEKTFYSI